MPRFYPIIYVRGFERLDTAVTFEQTLEMHVLEDEQGLFFSHRWMGTEAQEARGTHFTVSIPQSDQTRRWIEPPQFIVSLIEGEDEVTPTSGSGEPSGILPTETQAKEVEASEAPAPDTLQQSREEAEPAKEQELGGYELA